MNRTSDEKASFALKGLLDENERDRRAQVEALDGHFAVKAVLAFDTVSGMSRPGALTLRLT